MGQDATLQILETAGKPMRAIDIAAAYVEAGKYKKDDVIGGWIARDLRKLSNRGKVKQNTDKTWEVVKGGEIAAPAESEVVAEAEVKKSRKRAKAASADAPAEQDQGAAEGGKASPKAGKKTKAKAASASSATGEFGHSRHHGAAPHSKNLIEDKNWPKIRALRAERGVTILNEELTVLAREGIMDPDQAYKLWPQEGKNYGELVLEEVRMRQVDAAAASISEAAEPKARVE